MIYEHFAANDADAVAVADAADADVAVVAAAAADAAGKTLQTKSYAFPCFRN